MSSADGPTSARVGRRRMKYTPAQLGDLRRLLGQDERDDAAGSARAGGAPDRCR